MTHKKQILFSNDKIQTQTIFPSYNNSMNFSKSFSGMNLSRRPSDHLTNQSLREMANTNIPTPELLFEKLLVPPHKVSIHKETKIWKPDVESLQFDLINLKKTNNKLEEMIISYKLEIQSLKSDIKRLEKYQKHCQKIDKNKKQKDIEIITNELTRKKILKLKLQIQEYKKQLAKLKRIPESNILKQYEIQKQELIQQTIRLKAYIKAQMFQKKTTEITEEVIRNLKEELQKQRGSIRLLQNQNKTIKAKNNIVKKTNKQLIQEGIRKDEELRAREVEISSLSHQNQNLQLKRFNQFKIDQQVRQKQQINSLQGRLRILEDIQRQLEIQNSSLKDDLTSAKQKEKHRDQMLSVRLDEHSSTVRRYEEIIEDLENKLKNSIQVKIQPKKRNKTSQIYSDKQKLIKPVKISELQYECVHLKNVMRKHHLRGRDLILKQSYSITELCNVLKQKIGFTKQEALIVSRYIIQDDGLESVQIDMQISEKSTILISRLQHLAHGYDYYQYDEEKRLQRQWRNWIMTKSEELGRKINQTLKYSKQISFAQIRKLLDLQNVDKKMEAYLETQIFSNTVKKGFSLQLLLEFIEEVGGKLRKQQQTQTYFEE